MNLEGSEAFGKMPDATAEGKTSTEGSSKVWQPCGGVGDGEGGGDHGGGVGDGGSIGEG